MRAPSFWSLLLVLGVACGGVETPVPTTAPVSEAAAGLSRGVPDTPVGRMVGSLLGLLERGDAVGLEAWARRSYAPDHLRERFGSAEQASAYWLARRREFGPLEFHSTAESFGQRVFWTRGRISRAWVGLGLSTTDGTPARVTDSTLLRGFRPPTAEAEPAVAPESVAPRLAAWLGEMERHGLFSGAVVVRRDGELSFQGAYGLADRETGRRVTLDTAFNVASVGKTFTACAVLQLAAADRLRLDAPLAEQIPELPDAVGSTVTPHHLLTHTAGIELDEVEGFGEALTEADSAADLLAVQLRFLDRALGPPVADFRPAGEFDYSNEGYDLLGVLVERASGRDWQTYIGDQILAPPAMTRTGFTPAQPGPPLAVGYTERAPDGRYHPDGRQPAPGYLFRYVRPSGGLLSTAPDLASFAQALLEARLLPAAWRDRMLSPQGEMPDLPGIETRRGYGVYVADWSLPDGRSVRTVGKVGGIPGGSAQLEIIPAHGYVVAVVSNLDRVATSVAFHIRELLTDL